MLSPTSVTISTREEDFRAHGHTLACETHHLTTTAMVDTGCQSCLAGPSLMSSLHLSENELIPVSLVMHSASGTNLPILGAVLLRIRVQLTGIETTPRRRTCRADSPQKRHCSRHRRNRHPHPSAAASVAQNPSTDTDNSPHNIHQ